MNAKYQVYKKTSTAACTLDATLTDFKSRTWIYANSAPADPNICGFYITVTNTDAVVSMVEIIRTGARYLQGGLSAAIVMMASYYMLV